MTHDNSHIATMAVYNVLLLQGDTGPSFILNLDPSSAVDQTFTDGQELTDLARGVLAGTATVKDPGVGQVEIVSGKIRITGASDTGFHGPAIARAAGNALILDWTSPADVSQQYAGWGWDDDNTGLWVTDTVDITFYAQTSSRPRTLTQTVSQHDIGAQDQQPNTNYQHAVILDDVGAFVFIKGGNWTNWTLLWRGGEDTGDGDLYPFVHNGKAGVALDFGFVRTVNVGTALIAPEVDESSISTSTTFTHSADCFIDIELSSLPSSGEIEVRFRDDWALTVDSSGNVDLVEDADGTPTTRATISGATATDAIRVRMEDAQFDCQVDETYNAYANYTSGGANKTATVGSVESLGVGGGIARIRTWPLGISGNEYSDLDSYL